MWSIGKSEVIEKAFPAVLKTFEYYLLNASLLAQNSRIPNAITPLADYFLAVFKMHRSHVNRQIGTCK